MTRRQVPVHTLVLRLPDGTFRAEDRTRPGVQATGGSVEQVWAALEAARLAYDADTTPETFVAKGTVWGTWPAVATTAASTGVGVPDGTSGASEIVSGLAGEIGIESSDAIQVVMTPSARRAYAAWLAERDLHLYRIPGIAPDDLPTYAIGLGSSHLRPGPAGGTDV